VPDPVNVIVVGAGPGGATAALTLARAGVRVRIVDRAHFPRAKPCGGAVSVRALSRFPYLAEALGEISVHRVSRLDLESPRGAVARLASDGPAALMIRRVEFDALLLSLALRAGATISQGVEVTGIRDLGTRVERTTRRGALSAAAVIAADGVNSVVARRLGLNPGWPATHVALDVMEEAPADQLRCTDPDALWVSYGHGDSHGYAYVFPKRAHVNVGVGHLLDYRRRRRPGAPFELQRRLVARLNGRGRLVGDACRARVTPYLLPIGGPLRRTAAGRVMLVGDAGGFVNGFTAEGIYYAMVTGELAGRAVLAARRTGALAVERRASRPSPFARYERAWRREIGPELRDSVLVQRFLFEDTRRIDAMVRSAERDPDAADLIVRYAQGGLTYGQVRRRLLLRCPSLALRILAARATAVLPSGVRPSGALSS
jgi:geranylgeranyl reductase family protein